MMRENNIPLYALESGDALTEFDILGFTMQYELSYTNVLNMLELSGIPLRAADRGEDFPIVIGGGPCAYNPEPVADFFDLFNIGEGEEMLPEIVRLYIKMKDEGRYTRADFLHEAARTISGVYVPSLTYPVYDENGAIVGFNGKKVETIRFEHLKAASEDVVDALPKFHFSFPTADTIKSA